MKNSIRVTAEGVELLVLEPSHLNSLTLDMTVLNPTKVYTGVIYAFVMTPGATASDMVLPGSPSMFSRTISDGSKKVGLPVGVTTNDLGNLSGDYLASLNQKRYASSLETSLLDKILKASDTIRALEVAADVDKQFLKEMRDAKPYVAASYLWYPLNVAVRNFKSSGFYSKLSGDDKLFADNFISRKSLYLPLVAAKAIVKSALVGDADLDGALVNAGKVFVNDVDYMDLIDNDSNWINA